MTAAMEVLYGYAQDYMLRGMLAEEPEYADVLHCTDRREQKFRETLDEEGQEQLEAVLDGYNDLDFRRGQALFCAGFRLATELSRV